MRGWVCGVALVALIGTVLLLPSALSGLPVEAADHLKDETPEWEGILTIGVVTGFAEEELASWLDGQARRFERARPGALVCVRKMTPSGYQALRRAGALPDAVLLGRGLETAPGEALLPYTGQWPLMDAVEAAATDGKTLRALPVALGLYGILGNQTRMDQEQRSPSSPLAGATLACDETAREALAALAPGAEAEYERRGLLWPSFALEGRQTYYVATQREVVRAAQLRIGGRCFPTALWQGQTAAYTDQIAALAVVNPAFTNHGADAAYRVRALAAFAAQLTGEDAQKALAAFSLFSVREGLRLYQSEEALPDLAALERTLDLPLIAPSLYSPPAKP